eukprot:gene4508-6370_t
MKKEISKLFGPEDGTIIPAFYIKQIHRLAWTGDMSTEDLRGLCWRIMLGLISDNDKSLWASQLYQQKIDYDNLCELLLPKIPTGDMSSANDIKDPLSVFRQDEDNILKANHPLEDLLTNNNKNDSGDQNGNESESWTYYYKSMELINFIRGDLDRLYLSGIYPDDYFQDKNRRSILTNILFIWSTSYSNISYRQGMHEILGTILFVVEQEAYLWNKAKDNKKDGLNDNFSLYNSFTESTIESHTYWIFDAIMCELVPIYDPNNTQPYIVSYCTKIQEHYLRLLDPDLCTYLEESFVQAQLYGMRWSRLLLGREFPITHTHTLKLWDYLFACCHEVRQIATVIVTDNSTVKSTSFPNPAALPPLYTFVYHIPTSKNSQLDEDMPPNIFSLLANVRETGWRVPRRVSSFASGNNLKIMNNNAITGTRVNGVGSSYGCTPLLGALGDLMLAMLVQIREQLIESDPVLVMSHLMHYPEFDSILPIIDYADMIRRGVVMKDAHLGGFIKSSNNFDSPINLMTVNSGIANNSGSNHKSSQLTQNAYSNTREKELLSSKQSKTSNNSNTGALNEMGKIMSESLLSVKSIGNGVINLSQDFVQTISSTPSSAYKNNSNNNNYASKLDDVEMSDDYFANNSTRLAEINSSSVGSTTPRKIGSNKSNNLKSTTASLYKATLVNNQPAVEKDVHSNDQLLLAVSDGDPLLGLGGSSVNSLSIKPLSSRTVSSNNTKSLKPSLNNDTSNTISLFAPNTWFPSQASPLLSGPSMLLFEQQQQSNTNLTQNKQKGPSGSSSSQISSDIQMLSANSNSIEVSSLVLNTVKEKLQQLSNDLSQGVSLTPNHENSLEDNTNKIDRIENIENELKNEQNLRHLTALKLRQLSELLNGSISFADFDKQYDHIEK